MHDFLVTSFSDLKVANMSGVLPINVAYWCDLTDWANSNINTITFNIYVIKLFIMNTAYILASQLSWKYSVHNTKL